MSMTTAQLSDVSFLGRYARHTHDLYAYQLRRWFDWCQANGLDPLVGVQRAHVELYIRSLGEAGLMASSTNTMMHAVRGFFRFAHIDGLIPADPAVYDAGTSAPTHSGTPQSPTHSTPAPPSATRRSSPGTPTPRTTEHYDRARGNLDRHGVHFLTAYVAG